MIFRCNALAEPTNCCEQVIMTRSAVVVRLAGGVASSRGAGEQHHRPSVNEWRLRSKASMSSMAVRDTPAN